MFGINKMLTKWLIVIVVGIVAICAFALCGCMPDDGTDFTQRQLALATKTNVDSSQKDES